MDILTVNKDLSGGGCVELVKQMEDGGFTTTGRSNNSYLLAGSDGESEISKNELVWMISKRDIIELNGTSFEL